MNKIIRLSRANIRRHRTESVLLALLFMLCMLLLGGTLAAEQNIRQMFPEMMQRTGAWENEVTLLEKFHDDRFPAFLAEDERVTASGYYYVLYSDNTRVPDENGKPQLQLTEFLTETNANKAGQFLPQSTLTVEERAAVRHPVYIPTNVQGLFGLHELDPFTVIIGAKQFTFTVAGFYESPCSVYGRYVISEADYAVLKPLLTPEIHYGFNTAEGADPLTVADEFCEKCTHAPGSQAENLTLELLNDKQGNFDTDMVFILRILEIMAVVIILSVAVMIGYRIVSDIQEQIVSIGVLEALGYRTFEIALSYAAEYLLVSLTGCFAGIFGSVILFRVLTGIAERMEGYPVSHSLRFGTILLVFLCITVTAALLAFLKALSVRKYPPVQAFRKGIANHHFGKAYFPLRNTKKNVHLRLALKGFASRTRQNISLAFVISITTLAVVLSFILYSFMGRDINVIRSIAGQELSELQLQLMPGVDGNAFAAELETLPEIRKVLASGSASMEYVGFAGANRSSFANVFDDYSETENIHPISGRFPEHDNEIMLTKSTSNSVGKKTGDTVTLQAHGVQKDYLVTGVVTALVNADCVYFTTDGFRRLFPTYTADLYEVYVNEGVDTDMLRTLLDTRYGKSAVSLGKEDTASGSYEERIRQRAEQVMSSLMQQEGITQMEYAVQMGDTVISGSSSSIRIMDYTSWPDMIASLMSKLIRTVAILTRLFMCIAAAVVLMILSILMESEIRRQRRELGIMKSMGYTSKELMFQLTFRIMPAALAAVVTGTVLGILATKLFMNAFIGYVSVNLPAILAVDVLILAFCFGSAWLGARKIKKISVYELMTE